MYINLYSVPNFIVAIYSLFLGFFIISKKRQKLLNKLFFLFCFLIFIWLTSYGIVYSCANKNIALFFSKLGHVSVLFYAPLFFYICIVLTKRKSEFKYFIIATLINGSLLTLLFPTNLYISGIKKCFWGYYPIAGPILIIEIFVTLIIVIKGNCLLYGTYKYNPNKLSKDELNKLKYFTLAFAIYLLACFDFMQKYQIEIYPFGFASAAIFLSIISYSILKHQLLDINIVFRKGLIYSILLSIISILYFTIAFLLENIFREFIGYKSTVLTFSIIVMFILIFQPLKNRIQHIVDKYFFKGSIDQIKEENVLLREELQRSEKLKAVGTLAAGMAHEIKNPLTSIKTFTEYLPKKYQDKHFVDKFQKIVGYEVDKINNIVGQLLDFAKPKPLELKNYNIRNLIDEILDLLSNDFIKYKIKIIKDYKIPNSILKIDPVQIKQAALNIILNAIDAMKNIGGQLKITIQNQEDNIEIEFEDTGCGIDKKDLPHLFDPFYTTSDTHTGLGLSIVHGIIEKHHGRIEVKSELGKGTKFAIYLPKT